MGKRFPKQVACVYCSGGSRNINCEFGCIGCGACVEACRLKAIKLNDFGVAEVDTEKCVNCGLCMKACPKGIIHSRIKDNYYVPLCSNHSIGKEARQQCQVSCIGCGICVRNCPCGAIQVTDNCAAINDDLCLTCGFCALNCPRKVIKDVTGLIQVK